MGFRGRRAACRSTHTLTPTPCSPQDASVCGNWHLAPVGVGTYNGKALGKFRHPLRGLPEDTAPGVRPLWSGQRGACFPLQLGAAFDTCPVVSSQLVREPLAALTDSADPGEEHGWCVGSSVLPAVLLQLPVTHVCLSRGLCKWAWCGRPLAWGGVCVCARVCVQARLPSQH